MRVWRALTGFSMFHYVAAHLCHGSEFLAYDNPGYRPFNLSDCQELPFPYVPP